jgi:hypothetical protein
MTLKTNSLSTLNGSRNYIPDNAPTALAFRSKQISGPETIVHRSAFLALATFTPTIARTNVFRLSISNLN